MPAIILSDNGATSGSAGLKTSGGNDGVLQLQTTTSGGTPTTAISISNTQVVTYTSQPTYTGGTANGVLYLNGSKAVTSGTALVFDGSNLGIGVTPSAWGSSFKGIDVNAYTSFYGTTNNAYSGFSQNAYYNGTNWIYRNTNAASNYIQSGGTHVWQTAGSGTAGNAISFTSAMTLDASGRLGIATASPAYPLDVYTNNSADALRLMRNNAPGTGAGPNVDFSVTQTNAQTARLASVGAEFSSGWGGNLLFYTKAADSNPGTTLVERARITPGGEFLVGNTGNIGVGAKTAIYSGGNVLHIQSSNSGANNLVSYDSGGAATFYVSNSGSITNTSTTRSGEGYLSPTFYQNTGNTYVDLAQGDIYNIKDVSSPGNLNAMFNGQFSPYTQPDESMNWQNFRVIFRCTRNAATYDGINVTFRCVNYFYASGWTETGASFDFNGTDGERGYRWVVSPWYNVSNFAGGFDVPGWGIKLKTSSITVRIGSVFIQYRR